MLASVYTTHADLVLNPLLWRYACVNVLVITPILGLFNNCSERLFVVSRQHETSSSGGYARSLLRNQAQTAEEVSRGKISGVQANSVTKKSYSTTLADDHCSPLNQLRPQAVWSSNRDDVARLPPPALFNTSRDLHRTCNQLRLLYNHASAEAFTLAH